MPSIPFTRAVAALALGSAVACDATPPPRAPAVSPRPRAAPAAEPAATRVALGDVGLDPTSLDRTADPCADFYQFACGGWLARTEIPADRTRIGRNIELVDRNQRALRGILEAAAAQPSAEPSAQAVGTFYGTCVDEAALEAAGTRGIDPLLRKVRAVRDHGSLVAATAELHRHGIFAIFGLASEQDAKDATRVVARLDQGGIGLPDRDSYIDDDARAQDIRTHYRAHVARMMQLAGKPPAEAKRAADDVLALETALAKVSRTRAQRRDPSSMYNKVDRAGLARLAPTWGWDAYFRGLGFADLHDINVTTPSFVQGLEQLLASTRPAAWRAYLEWQVLSATADALPRRFDDEAFAMWRFLSGQQQRPERWRRCVTATDAALGEALGQLFVARHFSDDSREAVRRMIRAVSDAFAARLGELDWMDDATKARARDKRARIAYLIGYPSAWRVYDFALDPKVHAANVLAGQAFEVRRQLAKVGKPVDREDWQMSAPTVNAYYDYQLNQMAFPAGGLQPPFYASRASLAVNLGAIGETVGHELTHAFDDEGSQFDASGNLAAWWAPETRQRFEAKTQCLVDQYSAYEGLPGIKIDGKLTLGENVADLGGVALAFRAYRALRNRDEPRLIADGFDEDQQFFLAYGQASCTKWREERLRTLLKTDPHAPHKFRVNGVVANLPEFARAFACAAGAPLNPAQRCQVW